MTRPRYSERLAVEVAITQFMRSRPTVVIDLTTLVEALSVQDRVPEEFRDPRVLRRAVRNALVRLVRLRTIRRVEENGRVLYQF